jgi:hypothetical protein
VAFKARTPIAPLSFDFNVDGSREAAMEACLASLKSQRVMLHCDGQTDEITGSCGSRILFGLWGFMREARHFPLKLTVASTPVDRASCNVHVTATSEVGYYPIHSSLVEPMFTHRTMSICRSLGAPINVPAPVSWGDFFRSTFEFQRRDRVAPD